MKKLTLFIALFFSMGICEIHAQDYLDLMLNPDENTTLQEVQTLAEAYFEDKAKGRGSGYKQYKRWEYNMQRNVNADGKIQNHARRSWDVVQRLKSTNPPVMRSAADNWTNLGPSSYSNGNSGYNGGVGRVNVIAFHPTDANTIYLGTPAGGLWRSTNGGSDWTPLTDDLASIGISGIAVDHSNPNTIYILTGDGDGGQTQSIGVMKSTNGGSSWAATGLSWGVSSFNRGWKLLMHPTNSNIMLAMTSLGILKTTDGWATWTNVQAGSFRDAEFKPGDPTTVYAVSSNTFYKSTDTGDNWTSGGAGLPTGESRIALAVTPDNANYVYYLAGPSTGAGVFKGIYRSTDSGANFTNQSTTPNILGYPSDGSDNQDQSGYDLALAVNPNDANNIITGGINVWRSTNGGGTMTAISNWFQPQGALDYVHADIHELVYNPVDGALYVGSDGGISKSTNNGVDWTNIWDGLEIMQFYRIAGVEANQNLLIGGTQDNGTNVYTGSPNITHIFGADGMDCVIDYNNNSNMYFAFQRGGFRRSTDGGATSVDIKPAGSNGSWVTPYGMDPNDPTIIYGGFSDVYRSTDSGNSWSNLGSDGRGALKIGVDDPARIYASNGSTIETSANTGGTWTNISAGLPGLTITFIAIDPADANRVWVTLAGYTAGEKVYESTNAGATWTNISGTLPNLPALSIAYEDTGGSPADAIYVGMSVGVYYQSDLTPWTLHNMGLPNTPIYDLEINKTNDKIRAGTFGRGIWETPLFDAPQCSLNVSCALITDETISCRADLPPVDFDLPIIVSSCGGVTLSALTIIPGNSGCPGDEVSITRTYFVQDTEGNQAECMQTFTVVSNVAPTIACPANATVECAADINVSPDDATVTAECGTPVTSVSGPVINGTPDCPGTTYTYTYTVTDFCNRMASCQQVFTIANDEPEIFCPGDRTVECFEDIAVDPNDAVVTTSCMLGASVAISGPIQDGQANCPGTTYTYLYTATDDCGRIAQCKQVFTIQNLGPIVTCPADEVVQCVEDIIADPANLTVTTSCGLSFQAYVKQPLITGGLPGCDGTVYTYIYKVIDECGRVGQCEQSFLIQNDAPTITVPAGGTVTCLSDIDASPSDATVVTDCPSDTYVVSILPVTINGPKNCPGTTYTITYRVKDNCNRIAEVDRVFTNGQNAAPTIQAPADYAVECLAGINMNPNNATVTTACGNGTDYTVEVSDPQIIGAQDCPNTRYLLTYTVTDACGRTASDVQTLTVSNGAPKFSGCIEDYWLQFNCEDYGGEEGTIAAIEAYIASVEAYSACGDQLNVFNNFNSNNINTCINNGINTITFRATDNCGRSSFCTTTYVVVDTEAPKVTQEAQDHWEICNYNSPWNFQDWVADHGGAEAYDGCSNDNVFWSTIPANPTFNCMGANGITSVTVTFVVRDNCGNSTSTTATFNAFMSSGNNFVEDDKPIDLEGGDLDRMVLLQNRPNPFSDETTIGFYLPRTQEASLTIYDLSGKVIQLSKGNFETGYNEVAVNRNVLPGTGVFFYRLVTKDGTATRKMILH